jgi:hypothetical protein
MQKKMMAFEVSMGEPLLTETMMSAPEASNTSTPARIPEVGRCFSNVVECGRITILLAKDCLFTFFTTSVCTM